MNDLLVSDGTGIVMRTLRFTRSLEFDSSMSVHNTINCPVSILENTWAHRNNWSLGGSRTNRALMNCGPLGTFAADRPFGKLIVFNDNTAYALQNPYTFRKLDPSSYPPSHVGSKHQQYNRYREEDFPTGSRMIAQTNERKVLPKGNKKQNLSTVTTKAHKWTQNITIQARAMVLASNTLFIAGWRDSMNLRGRKESPAQFVLRAYSTSGGRELSTQPLPASPTYDGLIASNGDLIISLANGELMCLGK